LVEYAALELLCRENNVLLFIDNCEGFGSKHFEADTYFGARQAEAMTLSFFYSHQLPAIEGGMILTDDEEMFHHMLSLRAHGWTRDLPSNKFLPIDKNEFTKLFRFVLPGYCLRPMEINALLGLERLKRWPQVYAMRSKNQLMFEQLFSKIDSVSIQKLHQGQSTFGFGVLMPSHELREVLIDSCHKSGIQCRPIVAGNFLSNPVCDRIEHLTYGNFKVSDCIDNCGIFFGNSNTDLT
jgi:CDP-6-deoxy-D-xylo-4-hexulose-3-dehydrase